MTCIAVLLVDCHFVMQKRRTIVYGHRRNASSSYGSERSKINVWALKNVFIIQNRKQAQYVDYWKAFFSSFSSLMLYPLVMLKHSLYSTRVWKKANFACTNFRNCEAGYFSTCKTNHPNYCRTDFISRWDTDPRKIFSLEKAISHRHCKIL